MLADCQVVVDGFRRILNGASITGLDHQDLWAAVEVELRHEPLGITVKVGGEAVAVLNGRGKLRFEQFRQYVASEMAEAPPSAPEHTFGSFTDPMPFGSSSVGLDVSFPRATRARLRIEPHRRRAAPADRLPRRAQIRTGCPSARWRTRCQHRCLWTEEIQPYIAEGRYDEYAATRDIERCRVELEPGDLYFFNTRCIHEVPAVVGADPRAVLAVFIGYAPDDDEIYVWS